MIATVVKWLFMASQLVLDIRFRVSAEKKAIHTILSIYTGKSDSSKVAPLGTRVVQGMVDIAKENSDPIKHELFFDNFFTSYKLFENFAYQNLKASGAVRGNRTLGATKKMKTLKERKKSDRGLLDFHSDGKVYFCRWNNNSVVNIRSNYDSQLPVETVKRRVKRDSNVTITHGRQGSCRC